MGCVVRCHVVGVLEMEDDGEMDWKIIGRSSFIQKKYCRYSQYKRIIFRDGKKLFQHYKDLEGKTKIGDWLPKDKAVKIVKESIERYNDNKNI